jgi:hypothetical protein
MQHWNFVVVPLGRMALPTDRADILYQFDRESTSAVRGRNRLTTWGANNLEVIFNVKN